MFNSCFPTPATPSQIETSAINLQEGYQECKYTKRKTPPPKKKNNKKHHKAQILKSKIN